MPAPSEAPKGIKEHKVTHDIDAQRAGVLFQRVASAFGINPERKGTVKHRRILKDDRRIITEDLELQQSTTGIDISMLQIRRPGQYSVTIIPRQEVMAMEHVGSIIFQFPTGQQLSRSEEAYNEASNAVSAALQG